MVKVSQEIAKESAQEGKSQEKKAGGAFSTKTSGRRRDSRNKLDMPVLTQRGRYRRFGGWQVSP